MVLKTITKKTNSVLMCCMYFSSIVKVSAGGKVRASPVSQQPAVCFASSKFYPGLAAAEVH